MLHHSHLGYWLLPGNSFAITNFILRKSDEGGPADELIPLAREGIACDPRDPSNHELLIGLYLDRQDYTQALAACEQLQKLYEPMDERTLYCLKQNPKRARQIEAGVYDPAARNRERMRDIRAYLAGR
jgi:DNA-binding SARP family transcriptional activator